MKCKYVWSGQFHDIPIQQVTVEGIVHLLCGSFPDGEADVLQGVAQKDVFAGFDHGKVAFAARSLFQKGGKQGAAYKLAGHTAAHGEFREDQGLSADPVLAEAHDAVVAENILAGEGKDLVSRLCQHLIEFFLGIFDAGGVQLVGSDDQLIAPGQFLGGGGLEQMQLQLAATDKVHDIGVGGCLQGDAPGFCLIHLPAVAAFLRDHHGEFRQGRQLRCFRCVVDPDLAPDTAHLFPLESGIVDEGQGADTDIEAFGEMLELYNKKKIYLHRTTVLKLSSLYLQPNYNQFNIPPWLR